jgi:hypothetical protein
MCNDAGLIMAHGVIVRLGEEEFMTYWLMPWIDFLTESGDYDVQGENLTGKVFLFQVAGPRSLEILEAATGDDLHDIRFLRQRESTIAGTDVRVGSTVNVLRLGMAAFPRAPARRSLECDVTAAHLMERVLPHVPYRRAVGSREQPLKMRRRSGPYSPGRSPPVVRC